MSWGVIGAAALSAVLLWICSPAVGVGWLAWIALVPVATVVLADPSSRSARLAVPLTYALYLELLLVPALPFGLAEGQWGDPVLPLLIGDSPVLPVALVAVPLFGAALYAIRFGQPWLTDRARTRLAPIACVVVPAIVWTALDFARVKLDPGGYWGPLFLSQADTVAGDLAALAGPWLITASIVAVNYGVAVAVVRRRAHAAAIPVAAVAALTLVSAAIAAGGGQPEAGTGIRVAAVQPGYDTAEEDRFLLRNWERGSYGLAALDVIGDLAELTREAARRGAELVVWPEASIFVDPREDARVTEALVGVASATGASLVVPYFAESRNRSAALAVVRAPAGDATLTASRPKQRPMWFLGEEGGGEPVPAPVAVGSRLVGTLLGVDTQDPGISRSLVGGDAEVLTSSTHDWPGLMVQQVAFARLAARASGAPLVRADWRYGSAIYGRGGEELADAGTELRRTVLLAEVAASSPTPYARSGDWLGWAAVGLSLLIGLAWRAGLRL